MFITNIGENIAGYFLLGISLSGATVCYFCHLWNINTQSEGHLFGGGCEVKVSQKLKGTRNLHIGWWQWHQHVCVAG